MPCMRRIANAALLLIPSGSKRLKADLHPAGYIAAMVYYDSSALRPMGEVGGGLAIPVALVASVALLLVLLRYISIRLISSDQDNIKEVAMVKTLIARTRIFLGSTFETIWAIGVSNVVGHLST